MTPSCVNSFLLLFVVTDMTHVYTTRDESSPTGEMTPKRADRYRLSRSDGTPLFSFSRQNIDAETTRWGEKRPHSHLRRHQVRLTSHTVPARTTAVSATHLQRCDRGDSEPGSTVESDPLLTALAARWTSATPTEDTSPWISSTPLHSRDPVCIRRIFSEPAR